MVRQLDATRPLGREVRRVVRRRVRDSIAALEHTLARADATDPGQATDRAADPVDVADDVHSARRYGKEARSLLRLVTDVDDGPGRRLERAIRDAARCLSPMRDAHVAAALTARFTETSVHTESAPMSSASTRLDLDERRAIEGAIEHLARALEIIPRARFADDTDALGRGLRSTYRRSRRAYERAQESPTPRRLHRWRRWNKRLWYQVRFLAVTAPSVLTPLEELLDLVGESLGSLHDIDVFLTGDHADRIDETQLAQLSRERAELCARSLRWGATIHAERASTFAARLVALWEHAVELGPEPGR